MPDKSGRVWKQVVLSYVFIKRKLHDPAHY